MGSCGTRRWALPLGGILLRVVRWSSEMSSVLWFGIYRRIEVSRGLGGERVISERNPRLNEGGNGNQAEQGDSASGGHGISIQLVSEAAETVVEDATPMQPMGQRKRKTFVSDTGEPSHPPKKLREDHGTLSEASKGGKSISVVQRLLVRAMQNAEVRSEAIPTLPFVTSSVSAMLESEVDSFARPSIPLMTVATIVTSKVDPATTVKEKFVKSFVFGSDSSSGGSDHTTCGFSDLTSSNFIVGGIRTVISPNTDLQKFFASIRGMEHDQLFTEFNVGAARQMSLSVEVRMRAEYNIRERRRLSSTMEEKNSLLKDRDEELEILKAQLLVKEAEAAEAIRLRAEASKFEVADRSLRDEVKVLKEQNAALEQEKIDLSVKVADLAASVKVREQEVADLNAQVTYLLPYLRVDNFADSGYRLASPTGLQEKVTAYEGFIDQLEKFQDEKIKEVNEKFDKLCADFVEMALHLEEKFYPRLLTTISGRRWLLTHDMELTIAKCLNSTEYLSTLGAAIGKAVEKGMQEGLSAGITHGAEGRKLTDVAAYNPFAEADYLSVLQRLQSVNFSLIAELRANKDASIDTIMNLLRLEDTLVERLGLTELQPHVNQLMVPIHHSSDQRVIGASALLLLLDVSSSWVRKIKENITNHVSALRGVFVPLFEPLSAVALEGMKCTSGGALDDYEVIGADDQANTDGNVAGKDANHFPNVDDVELNVSE
ncbi:hypothetical protein Tco_0750935 [Tanacetum coccineum]|uniref:Transposase (Putative), gypsy type n=1 Tax=Tanacetum coccineum TaxID=301880 RepID=A0ABQ4Z2K5_9ASTR